MNRFTALDLFAGTGWGVACKRLGIDEKGVENMLEAIATREANDMETVFEDVWTGIYNRDVVPPYELLIASPPCQTFSMAGAGAGRKALDVVLGIITSGDYRYPFALAQFGRAYDPRTALVLTPLYYVWRDRPRFVVLEQVPTVLPVWDAYADEMRKLGYSVKTAILNAEQYGVPQTRKRAVLVARNDGAEVQLPEPTHSRYYSRDPQRLDEGVPPWVSMAEALGRSDEILRSNYGTGGDADDRGERRHDQPSSTITSKAGSMKWRGLTTRPAPTITGGGTETGGAEPIAKLARYTEAADWAGSTERLSIGEAAALQSYPEGFRFSGRKGKQFLQAGNAVPPRLAEAILSSLLA